MLATDEDADQLCHIGIISSHVRFRVMPHKHIARHCSDPYFPSAETTLESFEDVNLEDHCSTRSD